MNSLEELHRKGEQRAGWYLLSASLLAGVIWLVPVLWFLGSQDYSVLEFVGIVLILPMCFIVLTWMATKNFLMKQRLLK